MENRNLFNQRPFFRFYFIKTSNGIINITKKCLSIGEYLLNKQSSHRNILKYFPLMLLGLTLAGYFCQFLIQYFNPSYNAEVVSFHLYSRVFYATLSFLAYSTMSINPYFAIGLMVVSSLCNLYFDVIDFSNNCQLLAKLNNEPDNDATTDLAPSSAQNKQNIALALIQNQQQHQLKQLLTSQKLPDNHPSIRDLIKKMLLNHQQQVKLQPNRFFSSINPALLKNDILINGAAITLSCLSLSTTLCCLFLYANLSIGLASLMIVFFALDGLGLINNIADFCNQEQISSWQKQQNRQQDELYIKLAKQPILDEAILDIPENPQNTHF